MAVFVDTNVFVYAVGKAHPLREPARRLLDAAAEGSLRITTTPDVVMEFTHVCSRRRTRAAAVVLARDVALACAPMLDVSPADIARALDLFDRHRDLDAFDSLVAAMALNSTVDALVSADRGFGAVLGLPWHDLADLEVGRLIR
ncbi:MAG: PIN domain-containing protein [Acidimicrobiia bacterium]